MLVASKQTTIHSIGANPEDVLQHDIRRVNALGPDTARTMFHVTDSYDSIFAGDLAVVEFSDGVWLGTVIDVASDDTIWMEWS